jgi:hypothetical protein
MPRSIVDADRRRQRAAQPIEARIQFCNSF